MYSGSISFRELKNAKKILCLLGGVGAKIELLSKKNWGRILVRRSGLERYIGSA